MFHDGSLVLLLWYQVDLIVGYDWFSAPTVVPVYAMVPTVMCVCVCVLIPYICTVCWYQRI